VTLADESGALDPIDVVEVAIKTFKTRMAACSVNATKHVTRTLPSSAEQHLGQLVHTFAIGSTTNLRHHLLHDFAQVLYSARP